MPKITPDCIFSNILRFVFQKRLTRDKTHQQNAPDSEEGFGLSVMQNGFARAAMLSLEKRRREIIMTLIDWRNVT